MRLVLDGLSREVKIGGSFKSSGPAGFALSMNSCGRVD